MKSKDLHNTKYKPDVSHQNVSDDSKPSINLNYDLFHDTTDSIQILNKNLKIKFVNKAWVNKFGYSESEIENLSLKKLMPKGFEFLEKNILESLMVDRLVKIELTLYSKSGLKIEALVSIKHFLDEKNRSNFRLLFKELYSGQNKTKNYLQLYYSISSLASLSIDMPTLFDKIYYEINKVIPTQNFCIVLDKHFTNGGAVYVKDSLYGQKETKTPVLDLCDYVLNNKEHLLLYKREIKKILETSGADLKNKIPKVWLGIPLFLDGKIIGVLGLADYKDKNAFHLKELKLLEFISSQIAFAIDKKRKDSLLSIQSARQNAIFESGNHYIWSVDEKFCFTTFNKAFEKSMEGKLVYDKTANKWRKKSLTLEEKNQTEFWGEKYSTVFKEGKSIRFEYQWFGYTDLDEKWREVFLSPIYYKNGDIKEVSGFAHNITEQHKATLRLTESERKFRNIFESIQDLYFKCKPDGKIIMVSPSIKDIVGFDSEEILGKDITNYYLYDSKTNKLISKLLVSNSIHNFEAKLIAKNGTIIDCICNIRLIKEKDKPVEIEGIARDITELKKTLDKLKEASDLAQNSLRAKENFLANMSHEIRTPMNGIIGMIDLIAETKLNAEQREYIRTVKSSSETLLHILNDILDISKIEAGKMQLYKTPVDISNVLYKISSLFKAQVDKKDIQLTVKLSDDVPRHILIDETRILQVLSNLCSNAIKFTNEGGLIEISLSLVNFKKDKFLLKMEVKDNGVGIPKRSLEKIFKNFTQADISTTKSYGGVGLGLAISKNLCKLMGGEIAVESKEGRGSNFWFTFETEETNLHVNESKEQGRPELIDSLLKTKIKVLVVDDNTVNRTVSGQILKKAGCEVVLAEGGRDAIKIVESGDFDLIFMDIQMPEIDGVETMKELRRLHETLPPIVAMTAYAMREDEDRFINEGFDDYLAKPVGGKNLIEKVLKYSEIGIEEKKINSPLISENKENCSHPIIDLEVLSQLRKFADNKLLINIYEDFIKETQIQIESSINSITEKKYQNILTNLHTLKGNAGTLGIAKLAVLTGDVEKMLKEGDDSKLEADLNLMQDLFIEFKQNYNQLINPE